MPRIDDPPTKPNRMTSWKVWPRAASTITEEIRTMLSEGRSAQEITRTAAKVGYRPLRYDGLKKVLLGLTTIEEIEQNTSFEWAQ